MQEKKFNKKEYDKTYRKKHPKPKITIGLNSEEEKKEIELIVKKYNLTYAQIFKDAINNLKEKNS